MYYNCFFSILMRFKLNFDLNLGSENFPSSWKNREGKKLKENTVLPWIVRVSVEKDAMLRLKFKQKTCVKRNERLLNMKLIWSGISQFLKFSVKYEIWDVFWNFFIKNGNRGIWSQWKSIVPCQNNLGFKAL